MGYAHECYELTRQAMKEQGKKYEFQRLMSSLKKHARNGQFEVPVGSDFWSNYEYKDAMLCLLKQEGFEITYYPECDTHMISWREAHE